jgi:Sec-independent protein translocase protein TatA
VTPDSALGNLAQRLARLEQRVDDLMTRVVDKFNEIGEDFRVFGPMLQDHAKFRADMDHLSRDFRELRGTLAEAIGEFRSGLDELEARLEREARERQAIREAREQKEREREKQDRLETEERHKTERRDRWARWAIAASLLLTFVSMTVGWVLLATGVG